MYKLVKAEWYRLRKSGNSMNLMVFCCLIFILFVFTNGNPTKINLYTYLVNYLSIASVFIPAIIGTMLSVAIGNIYSNKTAHYEVMDGNSTHSIILSRLVVYLPIVTTLYLIPALVFIFITYSNGTGQAANPVLMIFLFILITYRMIVSAIFCVMSVKNHIAGAMIPYVRAMIESMLPISILGLIPSTPSNRKLIEALEYIFAVFAPEQMSKLVHRSDDIKYVSIILISCILDTVIGYICCVHSYNRKNFK